MESRLTTRLRSTPTVARSWQFLLVALLLLSSRDALAQPLLDETEVIRLARTHMPAGAVASATTALANARERTAGLFPNPSVTWTRETVETDPASSQDIVSATVPIQLSRPGTHRSLAASESAWMRAEAALTTNQAVLEALLAYYDAALLAERKEILTQALANLEEAARVLERREAAGTASGYESTRLAVATELSRSQLADAEGTFESRKARLVVLLHLAPETEPSIALLGVKPTGSEIALAERTSATREPVQRAHASERFAREARDRAQWAWLPTIELGAGVKRVSDSGGGYGYVVGVSVDLPIFDRGQALEAEAEAQTVLSTARARALERTIDAEMQSALAAYRAARRELERFEAQTKGQLEVLLVAAQSGYREGERSIVELLDAQRTQTEVREQRLRLLGKVKRAEAQLRAATEDWQ